MAHPPAGPAGAPAGAARSLSPRLSPVLRRSHHVITSQVTARHPDRVGLLLLHVTLRPPLSESSRCILLNVVSPDFFSFYSSPSSSYFNFVASSPPSPPVLLLPLLLLLLLRVLLLLLPSPPPLLLLPLPRGTEDVRGARPADVRLAVLVPSSPRPAGSSRSRPLPARS